jgi:hypothetical protein
MPIDAEEIRQLSDLIEEVNELVGVWEIWIDDCPVNPLKVKVYRLHAQGLYQGKANYSIQNPDQADPYRSVNPTPSIRESLISAINGFLMFYRPEVKEQTKFILDKNF